MLWSLTFSSIHTSKREVTRSQNTFLKLACFPLPPSASFITAFSHHGFVITDDVFVLNASNFLILFLSHVSSVVPLGFPHIEFSPWCQSESVEKNNLEHRWFISVSTTCHHSILSSVIVRSFSSPDSVERVLLTTRLLQLLPLQSCFCRIFIFQIVLCDSCHL